MKIDWKAFGHMFLVAGVAFVTIRAAESAFPIIQNVTRLPEKLIGMVPGSK